MGKAGGRFVRRLAVGVVTVLLSSFAVLGAASPAHAAGEGTILSLVNQARAANNLGPLKLNSAVSAVAAAWAGQMAANGAMTHNPSYSSQIPGGWTRAAENVAMGYGSPSAVHTAWMNSSGHRANILGDFTDIGISFISSGGTTWAVENFAKYGASVPPPAPPAPPPPPPPSPSPSPSAPPPPSPSPSPSPSTPGPPPAAPSSGGGTGGPAAGAASRPSSGPAAQPGATAEPTDPAQQQAGERTPRPSPLEQAPDDLKAPVALVREDAKGTGEAGGTQNAAGMLAGLLVLAVGAWTGVLLRRRWRPRQR